jgi:outer membrane protein assembly factor BamB
MGLNLSDGSTLWSHEISGPVMKSSAIGSTVAYISLDADAGGDGSTRSPLSSVLSGLDATTGEPAWSIDAGDRTLILVGTWSPAEGAPEIFVATAADGSLMVVDPGNQEPSAQLATMPSQPAISEPQGDQNGLYLTLQDGTLVAISPTTAIDGE